MNRFHSLPALLLTSLVMAPSAVAQDTTGVGAPDSTGYIIGHVRDDSTDLPVAAAVVSLPDLDRRTLTNSSGRFEIDLVPPGTHVLRVRHIRYGTRDVEITLRPGEEIGVELAFAPRAIEVEGLKVSVEALNPDLVGTGFYQRKMLGTGGFFGGEDYVKAPVRSYKTIKEALPEMRPLFVRSYASCRGPLLLNGRPFEPGYVNDYSRDLAGIEIYGPSEVPPGILEDLKAYREVTKDLPRHPAAGDGDDVERMKFSIRRCGLVLMWSDRDGLT